MQVESWLSICTKSENITMTFRLNHLLVRSAIASAIALTASTQVLAGQSSSASASASATIIQPIAIAKTADLVFGNLAVGATGGTVAISTANAVTIGGAGNAISQPTNGSGNPAAAGFTVTGESGMTYAISLPVDGTVTLADAAAHTMSVNAFTSNVGATGTLTGGTQTLKVGATLTVGNSQAAGTYSGSFSVTVAYN
jgi:Domain of unknown function (DUF4402)